MAVFYVHSVECHSASKSILVCSGLDSHLFQYAQKAHVNVSNLHYSWKEIFKLSRNEQILK